VLGEKDDRNGERYYLRGGIGGTTKENEYWNSSGETPLTLQYAKTSEQHKSDTTMSLVCR